MTDDLPSVRRAMADLRWLADIWPALAEARIPGTTRRQTDAELSAEGRLERDELARIERRERDPLAPGEHPAPVDLDVVQCLTDVAWLAEQLADEIDACGLDPWTVVGVLGDAEVAGADPYRPPRPSSSFADPRPLLRYAALWLPHADAEHGLIGSQAATWTREVRDQITAVLALRPDGQLLRIICPWCSGGWFGNRSLRVRALPGGMIAVVCESGVCAPHPSEAGTWWKGRPVWPLHMWPWLAKRVQAAENRERLTA